MICLDEMGPASAKSFPGHRLVLVFDTQDSLYGPPVRAGERFDMALDFSSGTPLQLKLLTR